MGVIRWSFSAEFWQLWQYEASHWPVAVGICVRLLWSLRLGFVTVTVAVSVTPALDMAGGTRTVPCCIVVSPRTVPLHGNNE